MRQETQKLKIKVKVMKRLLLLGTLLAVASFATGCATCGGYGVCGMRPMSCYSSCEPCATPCATPCAINVSPYAGQYYSGDECGTSCGGCSVGCNDCGESFRPFARWCNLFSLGGNCGCACERYYGDYINNPPSLCNPCDQYGGLAGFSAKCSSGTCDPYATSNYVPMSQPVMMSQPMMPASDCKTCNQGNTFYTSQARPQPQMQPAAVPQNGMMLARAPQQQPMVQQQPVMTQQPVIIAQNRTVPQARQQMVLQDKLVSGQQQVNRQQMNYRMQPIRQVSTNENEQFGTTSKVIQPATIPNNGRVIHAK